MNLNEITLVNDIEPEIYHETFDNYGRVQTVVKYIKKIKKPRDKKFYYIPKWLLI